MSGLQFPTIGALSDHVVANQWRVVDPGVPLTEYFDRGPHGAVWASQPSIRKVVGFIARSIASLPFPLYRRTDEGRVRVRGNDRKGAELARFLAAPTTELGKTPYRVWESLLIDGLINDVWCAYVSLSPKSGRLDLRRMPATKLHIEGDSLGVIKAVYVRRNDRLVPLDEASTLLDVGYADRGVGGTPPVRTLEDLLESSTEAVAYRRQMFRNGARVSNVIERPAGAAWSDVARDRFKRDWGEFARGGANEGGTALLEDGMQLKTLSAFKPRDTEDLESRRQVDIEVASMYHVAPELLGIREGTFSNIQAFMQQLYNGALGPYITAFEQSLNAGLLPMFGLDPTEFYIEANVESKLRGSFEEQAAIYSTSTGRPWMTTNEARDRQNLPRIEGGDELVTPLNVLVGGQASPQDGQTEGGAPALPATDQEEVTA